MLIHEVCNECSLTRKAVLYYMEQGLVRPSVLENGYRSFSEADIDVLKKVSILRKLGLSTEEIRAALSGPSGAALQNVLTQKTLELSVRQEKQRLLRTLCTEQNWAQTAEHLRLLEQKQSIAQRLLQAFPGYYGRYIAFHFASFLTSPIANETQQEAFDTIIAFLDRVDFTLPEDLRNFLDENTAHLNTDCIRNISDGMRDAIQDFETYLTDHCEAIKQYISLKQSEEYRASPAYRLEQSLRQFTRTSGYNDIFLPAMRRLSPSYQAYMDALEKANELFLQQFPQLRPVPEDAAQQGLSAVSNCLPVTEA